MIIGIDASRANKTQRTGVEWYSYCLIQAMKKIPLDAGDSFILYTPNELKGELSVLPINWCQKILCWPLKYLWTQMRLSWEMLINSPEVLFVPAHAIPIFSFTKNVITLHDLGFQKFPEIYPWWQRWYLRFVYWHAAHRAKKIIVPSEFTKLELINHYKIDSQKVVVVYLGYDDNIFKPMDREISQAILKKYNIYEPYLLFVGRLEKKKNLSKLLDIFYILSQQNKTLKLVLVGFPGFGYHENKNKIQALKNRLIILSSIDRSDLPALYSAAECFIFPSLYEGFGLPIVEAMACACPIVTSTSGSLPEIAKDSVIYCDSDNIDQWVEKIQEVIHNNSLRVEIINKGIARARDFSWQKCAKETYKTIKDLLYF